MQFNYLKNFISKIIESDLKSGKHKTIQTRFSPEPNGYLHIGHAKSICLNFDIANQYSGKCNLRFDDTNPEKENLEYIESIKKDINWMGYIWNGEVRYSSSYFEKLYEFAIELIEKGLAYVDQSSPKEIKNYRGTLTQPGRNSPYRNRTIKENLILFYQMRNGKFLKKNACLRAKIDMSSPFIILRDPILYRIKFFKHHQTGNKWCIYPTYDFAHCISDSIEKVTHSLCTKEFQDNRRLYDWILDNITISFRPKQYEFARLNLEYTVLSKRKLSLLVKKKIVDGWDDPRMPTISGLRRKGYTASSIRDFCRKVQVTKKESKIKLSFLESCIRKDLEKNVPRIMAVIDPVKIVIENLSDEYEKRIFIRNHPNRPEMGTREIILSREIYIDRSDFREFSDNQYNRLVLGGVVRLRNAITIKAIKIKKDIYGKIKTIFCEKSKKENYIGKIKDLKCGIIHWISKNYSIAAEFRFYDKLFTVSDPDSIEDFLSVVNPNSIKVYNGFIEKSVLSNKTSRSFQFERIGFFHLEHKKYKGKILTFNHIVSLKNFYKYNKFEELTD